MPDITMCKGRECSLSNTCYRAQATPSEYRQAYFTEAPVIMMGMEDVCNHYWKIDNQVGEERS